MLASRMSASRGITPLANIPDGECRDGPPELVIGREYSGDTDAGASAVAARDRRAGPKTQTA